ncbi:hypothetical protein BYT27DRAFT_7209888 [Phlegmacium glaucopus]|nr:hypothetical protein BYT27DRAFT_7209888 [Phlegmacium glaucopus]
MGKKLLLEAHHPSYLAQAELRIAHQAESQRETIAQLQREAGQWEDELRSSQEDFLHVEQERHAPSLRIDELVKLQIMQHKNKSLCTNKPILQAFRGQDEQVRAFRIEAMKHTTGFQASLPLLKEEYQRLKTQLGHSGLDNNENNVNNSVSSGYINTCLFDHHHHPRY